MRLERTDAGVKVLKDRSVPLSVRQRGALVLCDSRHLREEVLLRGKMAGISREDFQLLVELALVHEVADPGEVKGQRVAEAFAKRTPVQRFQQTYPLALKLAGSLGLRGFRLNLAVEKSSSYEDLVRLHQP